MCLCQKPIRPESLSEFCISAMMTGGLTREASRTTADVLVTTDTWGIYTHGSKQVRPLMKNLRDKRMDVHAKAEMLRQGPSWALIDGHRSMPMPTSVWAMQTAITKAQQTGVGIAVVRNSGHYGAAGYYAHIAAQHDMIGLSFTNTDPCVAVPGSCETMVGTNPLAYAVPAREEPPIMLDIATSVVAASKVFAARDLGNTVPKGWMVDKDGLPTTDPTNYPRIGALLPMAAHKGYGLALLVEILTGGLSGGALGNEVNVWWKDPPTPVNQSHSFVAIDIAAFEPVNQFKTRLDSLIRRIKGARKAKGSERIYLPGEMEYDARQRALKDGMILPDDVMQHLEGLADDYGLSTEKLYA